MLKLKVTSPVWGNLRKMLINLVRVINHTQASLENRVIKETWKVVYMKPSRYFRVCGGFLCRRVRGIFERES